MAHGIDREELKAGAGLANGQLIEAFEPGFPI